jgi:large subunit ribosomal protein L9
MKVMLLQDLEKVGRAGDQVVVADGYARNFLIPKRKAVPATASNIRSLDHLLRQGTRRDARLRRGAETLASRLAAVSCVIARPSGEQGRLFGSVTNLDIAEALAEQGLPVDRKKIRLREPIKALGTYAVAVRLHPEVVAELRVSVEHAGG